MINNISKKIFNDNYSDKYPIVFNYFLFIIFLFYI